MSRTDDKEAIGGPTMEWILYVIIAIIVLALILGLVLGVPDMIRYRRIRRM